MLGIMVTHYTLVEPIYCLGSDLAGKAFGVSLVEQEAMVVVGQVVEEKEWEESRIRASTPDEVHSTKVVAEHRIEMNGWLVGHNIEM